MIVETIQLYEGRPDVTLTSYVIADSPEMLNGKARPGVLICPGGAYLFCSDREAEPVALRFAAMGYHAFVLRYSTYFEGKPAPFPLLGALEVNPHSVHPAPMRDIGAAFLTLRAHADEWRLDMEKIALCGFSAGAHNCAMYATHWQAPVLGEFFGAPPAAFKPAAAILCYGLYDYHLMFGAIKDPFAQELSDTASLALMGTKTPDKALLDAVSPARHVSPQTPPIFLWSTAADELVPVENSTRMANALAQGGVPFEVHIFERGPHGLSLADQASANSRLELDADAAQWMGLAAAWLQKRFALPLAEKPAWMTMTEANN